MANYDAQVLQKFADELYARARLIQYFHGIGWAVVAFGISKLGFSWSLIEFPRYFASGIPFILAVAGCVIGVYSGRKEALRLKVQAQTALCQRQIEINTRPRAVAAAASPQSGPAAG